MNTRREPGKRTFGNCRYFTTPMTALRRTQFEKPLDRAAILAQKRDPLPVRKIELDLTRRIGPFGAIEPKVGPLKRSGQRRHLVVGQGSDRERVVRHEHELGTRTKNA
ncbi:MAG: hypothetical protein P8R42_08245 [Candidatus Binatia bacterium]|nr:hypothetical protein [Candidatus Binatia bacterium]